MTDVTSEYRTTNGDWWATVVIGERSSTIVFNSVRDERSLMIDVFNSVRGGRPLFIGVSNLVSGIGDWSTQFGKW